MNLFESIDHKATKAIKESEQLYKTSKEYYKLKVFQQFTFSISLIIKIAIIGSLLTLALFFCSIAGAIALGELLNNFALGFVIIAAFILLCACIFYYLRKKIDKSIIRKVSRNFFN